MDDLAKTHLETAREERLAAPGPLALSGDLRSPCRKARLVALTAQTFNPYWAREPDEVLQLSCVCGVGESTETCCLPIIKGTQPAKTAEELMRSRYSAYVLGEIDHLLASVHPDSPGEADRESTEAWAKAADWQRIEVVDVVGGSESDEEGEVEFIAHFKVQNIPQQHHERARFKKHNGKWLYFDGDHKKPEPIRSIRVGRNDPCPCGSGKKFKKCYPNCPNPFPDGYSVG